MKKRVWPTLDQELLCPYFLLRSGTMHTSGIELCAQGIRSHTTPNLPRKLSKYQIKQTNVTLTTEPTDITVQAGNIPRTTLITSLWTSNITCLLNTK